MRTWIFPVAALLVACGGGKPIESKEELAESLAHASIPATHAKGAALRFYGSAVLPEPSFTIKGNGGGEVTISMNPVGGAIGLAAQGVLFDLEYRGFSPDGLHYLDGTVAVVAQFEYRASALEPAHADLKLSLVGRLRVTGIYRDEMKANVTLLTRFHDLSFREESIDLRLTGSVTIRDRKHEFLDEDLKVLWARVQQR